MISFGGADDVSALVLDVGKNSTKFGYAGEELPRAVFPSEVGYFPESSNNISNSSLDGPAPMETDVNELTGVPVKTGVKRKNCAVGENEVYIWRENMEVRNPYGNTGTGLIEDWDAFESILDYSYANKLRLYPDEHPLLISESSWNTKEGREKLAEIAFETYKVPALYLSRSAVLSAFASGKSSALVVDSGAATTSAVPVFDGYVLKKGIQKNSIAGDFLSEQAKRQLLNLMAPNEIVPQYLVSRKHSVGPGQPASAILRTYGQTHRSFHEFARVLHEFKETVSMTLKATDRMSVTQVQPRSFEFPNGYNTLISDRWRIPEIMFQPNLMIPDPNQIQSTPLPTMINESINLCDTDVRPTLFANIVLCGGSTLFSDFPKRVENELSNGMQKIKIHAAASSSERRFASWIGGSVLGSLGTFQQLWVGKQEWEESGVTGLEKRWS
ncbi:Actin-like 6A [Nowakowskiella sp. JEL0078]|nr:Actin-like 6A [Nowakowskiella sp. JEL0078]